MATGTAPLVPNNELKGTFEGNGCFFPKCLTLDVKPACGGGICVYPKCGSCPWLPFYACPCTCCSCYIAVCGASIPLVASTTPDKDTIMRFDPMECGMGFKRKADATVVAQPVANAQLMEGGNLNPNITSAEDAAGCYLGICCPFCCFPIFSSYRAAGPDALKECSWWFPTPLVCCGCHMVRESPDSRWFRLKGDNSVRKEVFANYQIETGPFHRYCAMKIC